MMEDCRLCSVGIDGNADTAAIASLEVTLSDVMMFRNYHVREETTVYNVQQRSSRWTVGMQTCLLLRFH